MIKYVLSVFLLLSSVGAHAQYPTQYGVCGSDASDSACLITTNGGCTVSTISRRVGCETVVAGRYGYLTQTGERRACTGQETWETIDASSEAFRRFCSGCNTMLTDQEFRSVQNAILGLSEAFNTGLLKALETKRGLTYYDGETVMNELSFDGGATNAAVAAGRAFRERTWVPSPFADGGATLPTTARIHSLVSTGAMSSKVPGAPDSYDGNVAFMYEKAILSSQTYTNCQNDPSSCNLSACNSATPGIFDSNCRDVTIVTDLNSCGSPFYRFLNWTNNQYTPTTGAQVPWSGPGNFANRDWTWNSILPWNGGGTGTGGDAFMCSSTIYSCTGWRSQGQETVCEGTWTEQYTTDPITGDQILTGISCVPGAGQRGLFTRYYYYNDCTPEQTIIEIPPPLGQDAAQAAARLACCNDTSYPSACALGTDPSATGGPGVVLGPPPPGCASWADVGVEVGRFCSTFSGSFADYNTTQTGVWVTYDCSGRHTATAEPCTKPPLSSQTCSDGGTPGVPIGSYCDSVTNTWIQVDCNSNGVNTGVSCSGGSGCTANVSTSCSSAGKIISYDSCGNAYNTEISCTNTSGTDTPLTCSGGQAIGSSWTRTETQDGCTRTFGYSCVYYQGAPSISETVSGCQ